MSKAFVRESDVSDSPDPVLPVTVLPLGAKNYLTPGGARRLRVELERLVEIERPRLTAARDDEDAKRELRSLDQRIRYLGDSLRSAEVVPVPATPDGIVRFGATVLVRDGTGTESRYRIVGVDEAEPERGWVSWLSPIARALTNARVGEQLTFQTPRGPRQLEIVGLEYTED